MPSPMWWKPAPGADLAGAGVEESLLELVPAVARQVLPLAQVLVPVCPELAWLTAAVLAVFLVWKVRAAAALVAKAVRAERVPREQAQRAPSLRDRLADNQGVRQAAGLIP